MMSKKRILAVTMILSLLVAGCGGQFDVQVVTPTPSGSQTETTATPSVQPANPPTPRPTAVPTKITEVTATVAVAPTAVGPVESPPSAILFASYVYSDTEIINTDLYLLANGETTLVASGDFYTFPESPVSSDRTAVVYHERLGDQVQVLTIDAEGKATRIEHYRIPEEYDAWGQKEIQDVIWSPDGTRLAIKTTCSVYILTLPDGRFTEIVNECYSVNLVGAGPQNVAWSPDSTRIAFDLLNPHNLPTYVHELHGGGPARLIVADAESGESYELDELGSHPIWSPDSQQILYMGGYRRDGTEGYSNEKLYVTNVDGTSKVKLAEVIGESQVVPYFDDLGWLVDGQKVYFVQGGLCGQLSVVDFSEMDTVVLGDGVGRVDYSPQSGRIAWSQCYDSGAAVFVSDPAGTMTEQVSDKGRLQSFSPCGDRIVWDADGTWYVSDLDGGKKIEFPSEPVFSPDCSDVAFVESHRIYISDGDGNRSQLTGVMEDNVQILAWLP
jgi:Tol biopolymer transport system component